LPHLRFTRDKRGYENTYVVHAIRRRGKARQRILYWFRTPPNVRVGRAALDEGAIRALEEQNPEILFDWTKILEAQPTPPPPESAERRRRSRREPAAGRGRPPRRGASVAPVSSQQGERSVRRTLDGPADVEVTESPKAYGSPESAVGPESPESPERPERPERPESLDARDADAMDAVAASQDEPADREPALVPVTVYHGGADVLVRDADSAALRSSPAETVLGFEQLGRTRARYAEIMARISERVGNNPPRLEELRRAAEALNPDGWVTEAEVASGLQQFDARLGEIRRALGIKRRRRSRRGGRRRRGASAPTPFAADQEATSEGPAEAESPEDSDDDPTD